MKDVSDNNNNFLVGSGIEKRRVENLYSVNAVVPFVLRSLKEKDFSIDIVHLRDAYPPQS